MPELRQNPVNKHWVIIAEERAKRPKDIIKPTATTDDPDSNSKKPCPFDEGKETETPPEVLAYSNNPDRAPNTGGWIVRMFPNKYPTFEPSQTFHLEHRGIYSFAKASGSHEIVTTRDHHVPFALLPEEDIFLMFKANKERMLYYKNLPYVTYTLLFCNQGKESGASFSHPHTQFVALPVISSYVSQELINEQEYIAKHATCGHCAMIAEEIKEKKRVISQNNSFISFAPFAARDPFEIVIYPLSHASRFEESTDEQLRDLASVLKDALYRLYEKLQNPSFNYYVHTAPHNSGDYSYSHWHLKILPRLSLRAGFELATGIVVNVVSPESAAEFLRGKEGASGA